MSTGFGAWRAGESAFLRTRTGGLLGRSRSSVHCACRLACVCGTRLRALHRREGGRGMGAGRGSLLRIRNNRPLQPAAYRSSYAGLGAICMCDVLKWSYSSTGHEEEDGLPGAAGVRHA
jgi:hypothetical protein